MAEHKEDQDFQQYLDGQSELSSRYKHKSTESPSRHVDESILKASRENTHKGRRAFSPFSAAWPMPMSLAAVLIMSVGIVFIIQDDLSEGRLESEPVLLSDDQLVVEHDTAKSRFATDTATAGRSVVAEAAQAKPGKIILEEMASMSDVDESLSGNGSDMIESLPAAPMPSDAPQRKIAALKDEISELKENRQRLIAEKTELEVAQKAIKQDSLHLKKQIAGLEAMRLSRSQAEVKEIKGSGPQVAWLNHIHRLWSDQQIDLAAENLRDFRQAHPDYARSELVELLPESLLQLSDKE